MKNYNNNLEKRKDIERSVSDHIFQLLRRIEENIQYIIFLRRNSKLAELLGENYYNQIDRFSRDTVVSFLQILDKNDSTASFVYLIGLVKDKELQGKLRKKLENLKNLGSQLVKDRNKIVGHYEINHNIPNGEWYPAVPGGYLYLLNPCYTERIRIEAEKLYSKLVKVLKIEGLGFFVYGEKKSYESLFPNEFLGAQTNNEGLKTFHNCKYRSCFLKQ